MLLTKPRVCASLRCVLASRVLRRTAWQAQGLCSATAYSIKPWARPVAHLACLGPLRDASHRGPAGCLASRVLRRTAGRVQGLCSAAAYSIKPWARPVAPLACLGSLRGASRRGPAGCLASRVLRRTAGQDQGLCGAAAYSIKPWARPVAHLACLGSPRDASHRGPAGRPVPRQGLEAVQRFLRKCR